VVKSDKKLILKLRELGEGEKVSIISDVMFKTMFQNSKRIKYSAKLISYFIDVSYEKLLNNLRLVQNDFDNEKYYSKGERGDYVAEIDGTHINIEINNNFKDYTFERNLEYMFRIYNSKVRRSKGSYGYEYNKVVQINFNNFYYKDDKDAVRIFTMNDGKVKYTDKIIIVQVYLPLLRKKWYDLGIENLEEKEKFILSLYEMNINSSKEIGGKINIMNDYLEESKEVMEEVSFGESYDKELATYEGGYDEGREAGYDAGREVGREEGLAVGREETMIETAKKMKDEGIDVPLINKITGLSLEKIQKL
jgi:predicted transposase/invertase (TIGR01784 family)